MRNFRIISDYSCYNGRPIMIYVVQVKEPGCCSDRWRDIKGFNTYKSAKELLNILEKNI